jgi:hypothetical protein
MANTFRGLFVTLAMTVAGMAPAAASGGDQPASCHDNCTILVFNTKKGFDADTHPTVCHDNCTIKTTDPSTVSCHDRCKIVYLGGLKEPANASCHDNCKIVAVNSNKRQGAASLTGTCHDNCKIVAVNQKLNNDSSCHNNCKTAQVSTGHAHGGGKR